MSSISTVPGSRSHKDTYRLSVCVCVRVGIIMAIPMRSSDKEGGVGSSVMMTATTRCCVFGLGPFQAGGGCGFRSDEHMYETE